jgi:DNA-binding MarR family transcriptional regulator
VSLPEDLNGSSSEQPSTAVRSIPGRETPQPESFLGYRVVRLAAALEQRFKRDLGPHQLTPRQFSVLAALAARPDITTAELARTVLTTPQSMAALVQGLVERGLIARAIPRLRGVTAPLRPTDAGRAALAAAFPDIAATERALFGALTAEDRATLRHVLDQLDTAEPLQ